MAEFPALPLWTDAYLGDTTHLNTKEHGAYFLLLISSWRTPNCSLPDDDKMLSRLTRLGPREWAKMRPVMEQFFTVEDGRWTQKRLVACRQSVASFRKLQSEKGKLSGEARALKNKGNGENRLPDGSTPDGTEGQPKRTNHNHIHKNNDKSLFKHELPEDWEPEQFGDGTKSREIVDSWTADERALQLEAFRAHHSKEGSKFKDWQSAWSTWVLNSRNFAPKQKAGLASSGSSFIDAMAADYLGERREK